MGFKKSTAKILSENRLFVKSGRILDVGCGKRIYEYIFPEAEYIGIDIETSGRDANEKLPDIYFDGTNIPFEEDYFDFIVCTEVLEHCKDPKRLLDEMYRVLKPEGRALITTPFLWGEHEIPYDFRRYTSYGLTKNILSANFKIIDFKKDYPGFSSLLKIAASELSNSLGDNKSPKFLFAYLLIYIAFKFIEKVLRIKASRIYLTNQIMIEK